METRPELNKVIWDSMRLWPRKWLLTVDVVTPMGSKNLSKQFARIIPNAPITITWMRKMYVSMRYWMCWLSSGLLTDCM